MQLDYRCVAHSDCQAASVARAFCRHGTGTRGVRAGTPNPFKRIVGRAASLVRP
jgi:hypothetical protein